MINRCVCHDLLFSVLVEKARAENLTFEQLSARTKCSTSCALCEPYIREALRTGQVVFTNPLPAVQPRKPDNAHE